MREEVERRIGWGYGYGAGYVDALRGRPANNVAPPDGRVREGEYAEPNPGPATSHDFNCTHNPCRCAPQLRSSDVDIVAVLRHLAHPNLAAQWTVLLDAAHEIERLRERADLLDRLHDEGFPDEPYLSGRLRAEIERLEGSA